MFGKCQICIEKDLRIKDLKDQIVSLQKLALPQTSRSNQQLLDAAREFDHIINGEDEMFIPSSYDTSSDIISIPDSSQIDLG